jgi:integrase
MLNDTRVRNAKRADRPIKLSDSGGLHLLIQPNGSKLWRLAYRFGGKQKTLAIGVYPTVTLKHAREKRDEAKRLLADNIDWLFPSVRSISRPMSENTLNAALCRLGYSKGQMTAHGFKAMASTRLNEMGCWNPDAIERQLAHRGSDDVRRAYMHAAEYWPERVMMMQAWADYLDELRDAGKVIPLTKTMLR